MIGQPIDARFRGSSDCAGVLGLLGLLAAGCATAPAPPAFSETIVACDVDGVPGRRITTDHFQFHSTLTDADLEAALPAFLESVYGHYVALLPVGREPAGRIEGYVFQTRRQWERFTRRFAGPAADTYLRISSGGYTRGATCVLYHIGRSETLAVLAHEGLHAYVAGRLHRSVPAWLNEGLACYVESAWFADGTTTLDPERNLFRLQALREAIASDRLFALPELLDTNAGNVLRAARGRVPVYYAQAWSLVVFLRHGPVRAYARGFERLLAAIGTDGVRGGGAPGIGAGQAVFRQYITDDLDAFSRHYRDYVLTLTSLAG